MNARAHRIIFDRARGLWLAVAENVRTCRAGARSGAAAVLLSAWGASGLAVAQTLPGGGAVVQGAGSIEAAGSAMVVRQDSARMVADWQSFSIGSGASVRFAQPSTSAVALNRVVGSDPSSIFGSLTSNGHVYLQNPNGVLFAPGARVDVGSLVATTLKADMPSFLDGRLRLSGDGGAAVINQGQIQAAAGGSVVLAGPQVANHGRIVVPGGTIALAAGQAVNVDATGSGLLSIEVPLAAIGARLDHSGLSQADGGLVSLQAAAADAARRTVMQVDGVVRARRIEQRGGQIVLAGGPSGDVLVGAQLDVSAADGRGGELQVLGERVALVDQASLDARGAAGGGSVLVGGNLQGHGPQPNASTTMVGAGVAIDASATQSGDGGQVIVWSDGHTGFAGTLRSTGGPAGGNGGLAEVSGKRTLDFQGQVDLRAPLGRQGSLLLDPDFIVIGTVADVNGDFETGDDLPGPFLPFDAFPGASSQITAGRVASLLEGSDVVLQAAAGIDVIEPVLVAPGAALSTLTLEAPSVSVHAPMTLNNSSLSIRTTVPLQDSVTIDASIQSLRTVSITATSIGLLNGVLDASLVRLDSSLDGSGSAFQSSSHAIHANTLMAGAFGSAFEFVDLFGSDNQLRTVYLGANSAYLHNANNGFRFDLGGTVSVLDVEAISGIVQTTPIVSGHLSIVTSDPDPVTGAVDLGLPTNDIGQVGFSVGGRFNFRTQGDLAVDRVFVSISETDLDTTAGGSISLEAGGRFTLLSSIQATGVSGPATIDIRSVGFDNTGGGLLLAQGGRFLVKSDDFTADNFGPIGFGRTSTDFGFVVYDGFAGEVPTSGNGLITNQAGALTIDPADLGPISRPYDGTTAFTASLDVTAPGAGTSAVAFVPPGSVSLLPVVGYQIELNGNFDTRHAGVDKGFSLVASQGTTVHGADGAGAQVDYYGLQLAPFVRPAGPSAAFPESRVTPLPIAVAGLVANDKVYDATTAATLSGVPTVSVLAGDDASLSGSLLASFADKTIGAAKPVTVSGGALVGADAGNYVLSMPVGLSANVSPLGVTLVGLSAQDKVYDATMAATLSGVPTVSVLAGDDASLSDSLLASFADKTVGAAKPVTVSGGALVGADAGNYVLSMPVGLSASISPLGVTLGGVSAQDKVYDATIAATLSGVPTVSVLAGDDASLSGSLLASFADKTVGAAKPVTVSGGALVGADAGNYVLSMPVGLSANVSPLGVTLVGLSAQDKVYDATTVATLSGAPSVSVLAGDEASLSGTLLASFADKAVGVAKPVTVSGGALVGADAGNYVLSMPVGLSANVSPLGVTLVGLSAHDKVYDATTVATLSGTPVLNLLAGDIVSLAGAATGSFVDKQVGVDKPVSADGLSLVGADAGNYTLISPTGLSASIAAREIAPSGIRAIDRVADGQTRVELDTSLATLVGLLPGDLVTIDARNAFGQIDSPEPGAGKPVTLVGLAIAGNDAVNYRLDLTPAGPPVTVTVVPALRAVFEELRFKEYLQGVSDAQEPFRRAMAEALAAGFGKENIRKRLSVGLVFETGLAVPAIDDIQPAKGPGRCTLGGAGNGLALSCP